MYTIDLNWFVILLTFTSWGYYLSIYILAKLWNTITCYVENTDEDNLKDYLYTIMIPCLNEEKVILNTLLTLDELKYPTDTTRIRLTGNQNSYVYDNNKRVPVCPFPDFHRSGSYDLANP